MLEHSVKYLLANKEWIFSGIGIFVISSLLAVVGFFYKRKQEKKTKRDSQTDVRDRSISKGYHLKKIETLFDEIFTDEELRCLCYDTSELRPVYDQLGRDDRKTQVIKKLISYADQTLQVETILAIADEHDSATYKKYHPYYYEQRKSIKQEPTIITWLIKGFYLLAVLGIAAVGVYLMTRARPPSTLGRWIFVVDASTVMNEMIDGKTKMGIARAAVNSQLGILPPNVEAGLRIFGGGKSGLEACEDTMIIIEPAPQQNERISSDLDKIYPVGEAPLIKAISQAIGDFDPNLNISNTLIVITGGIDTCRENPVGDLEKLINRLDTEKIRVELHLIGLNIEEERAWTQLKQIAQITNGHYYDARNEDDVKVVLELIHLGKENQWVSLPPDTATPTVTPTLVVVVPTETFTIEPIEPTVPTDTPKADPPTRMPPPPESSPPSKSSTASVQSEAWATCRETDFVEVADRRWATMEVGLSGRKLDLSQEDQVSQDDVGPFGVELTQDGQPLAVVLFLHFPSDKFFKIMTIIDARCNQIVDYTNVTRGGDKNSLQNWDVLKFYLEGGAYTLRFGDQGSAIWLSFQGSQEE